MNKKVMTVIVVFAVLFSLTACTEKSNNKESRSSTQDTINIVWSGPLSGDLASLGINNMRGIQIAADEINAQGGINGKKLNVVFEDDRWEEKLAKTIYEKHNDKEVMLTASYVASLTLAQQAKRDNRLLLNVVDTSNELASIGAFASGIYDEGIGYSLADGVIDLGQREVALITLADPFVGLVSSAFKEKFEENGGKIVFDEIYTQDIHDAKTLLLKVQDVPNIVLIGFDEAGFIIKQARQLGINTTFFGIDTFSSEVLYENSNGAVERAYFTFWETRNQEKLNDFLEKHRAKFGEEPSQLLFAATGYDGMHMVAKAIRKSDGSAKGIEQSLLQTRDVPGLAGDLTMDPDGIVRSIREELYQVKGKNEFVKV